MTLFSADPDDSKLGAVATPSEISFSVYGWDVNDEGAIIYADPGGEYRVHIRYPGADTDVAIDLPQWRDDEDRYSPMIALFVLTEKTLNILPEIR